MKIGWNPDRFGYNWQLPQIYKRSGMDYFVTQKLLWAHEFTTFPYKPLLLAGARRQPHDDLFPAVITPTRLTRAAGMAQVRPGCLRFTARRSGSSRDDAPLRRGRSRRRADASHARQCGALEGSDTVFPKLQFSFARDFFRDMEKKLPTVQVPMWDGELYFQYHRGVFTTQAETKRRIRRSEENVLNAEKFASIALLYGRPYPQMGC